MRRLVLLALSLSVALAVLPSTVSAGTNFVAPMSGDEEVPPVETQARGVAKFKLRDQGLVFKVNVANIEDVAASHIHCGAVGVNGPIGVTLFETLEPVSVNGTLAKGVITAPDEDNDCEWTDLDAVVAALESGNTYVNVHTVANPGGEIRGQVK
jgi:CHRD domain